MALITGTGQAHEADDIGEGAAVVSEPLSVEKICFLLTKAEDIASFGSTGVGATGNIAEYVVLENAGTLTVSFIRVNPRPGRPIDLNVFTRPITAVAGVHYTNLPTPVIFQSEETFIERPLTILNAGLGNGVSRSLVLEITRSGRRYTRGPVSHAKITINGVSP